MYLVYLFFNLSMYLPVRLFFVIFSKLHHLEKCVSHYYCILWESDVSSFTIYSSNAWFVLVFLSQITQQLIFINFNEYTIWWNKKQLHNFKENVWGINVWNHICSFDICALKISLTVVLFYIKHFTQKTLKQLARGNMICLNQNTHVLA